MEIESSIVAKTERPEYARTLIAIRESKGLTQKELANRLCISPMMLSYYENGKRSPSLDRLNEWATALGVVLKLVFILTK